MNSPIADAEAITRINECADPPPPPLHLRPPRITLPPPPSIWQIHPHSHLPSITSLFSSTSHTPNLPFSGDKHILSLYFHFEQVSHIHGVTDSCKCCNTRRGAGVTSASEGGCVPTGRATESHREPPMDTESSSRGSDRRCTHPTLRLSSADLL